MPTGVVLAGGLGRRMGGASKPGVEFGGRPMIAWPLTALEAVCDRVAVVCKADTELPELPGGVERWDEPAMPRHPLTGIVCALERAGGPVVVCAADMPFVSPTALRDVWEALDEAVAAVAWGGGHMQPLLAAYAPAALERLRGADDGAPLTASVRALGPVVVTVPDHDVTSIDTREALRLAQLSWRSPEAG